MSLFKGGRRLLAKMEITLINNYAFSNTVVKMCETFTYLIYQWDDVNGQHYFLTNIHLIARFPLHCNNETLIYP
jgi:hypothetical protein